MASACPVEEGLDERWFTDQMDRDGGLVTQEKPKKPRWETHKHADLNNTGAVKLG